MDKTFKLLLVGSFIALTAALGLMLYVVHSPWIYGSTVLLNISILLTLMRYRAQGIDQTKNRIDPTRFSELMHDPVSLVRLEVAMQISVDQLPEMMKDPSEVIRGVVADRISVDRLSDMMGDVGPRVRGAVAKRIPISRLPEMMADEDWIVRWLVARRIDQRFLVGMLMKETNSEVIETLTNRIQGHCYT